MKEKDNDLLIVGAGILCFTALAFLAGYIFGHPTKEQMVVTAGGELELQEVES